MAPVPLLLSLSLWLPLVAIAEATAEPTLDNLTGHWSGAFVRDGSVQIVEIDFDYRSDSLVGAYSIPDLGLYAEPLVELAPDSLQLSFRLLYGTFAMHLHDSLAEMTGVNANWGPPVYLHLKRTLPDPPLGRTHVYFQSGDLTLAGTVMKPPGDGPFPGVVIVHGSGDQGRQLWSYRSWGEVLARHGIASLVYDKRGVGESSGDHTKADFSALAADAASAFDLLRRFPGIDLTKVGLLGISQGGWLAPLAARKAPEVAFLILIVGPAVPVWVQERHRVEFSLRAESVPQLVIDSALAYTDAMFAAAGRPDRWPAFQTIRDRLRDSPWSEILCPGESQNDIDEWLLQNYDPAATLRHTTVPVLALFGEDDPLVPPSENVPLLKTHLSRAANNDVTVILIPGVDHSLETSRSLIGGEWSWPTGFWRWPRRAPGVYESVVDWLTEKTAETD